MKYRVVTQEITEIDQEMEIEAPSIFETEESAVVIDKIVYQLAKSNALDSELSKSPGEETIVSRKVTAVYRDGVRIYPRIRITKDKTATPKAAKAAKADKADKAE